MREQKRVFPYKPQINISFPSMGRMWLVCGCAFACVVQSSLTDGGRSLLLALVCLVTALTAEISFTWREFGAAKIKDGSAAATAMIFTLLLPNQIHPFYAVVGILFAVLIVKYSFGGLGSNWLNPALGGWLFIRFSWPLAFSGALDKASADIPEISGITGSAISNFLNKAIFRFLGTEMPSGYIELFSLQTPGIIADRAVLILVFGTIVIASSQISRSWLSFLYLAVFGLLVRLAGDMASGELLWNGDVVYAIFSGGTLVTAFFLIADPSSGARSAPGNALMAIMAAALSMVFRYFGNTFYGGFFAVAIVNACTPLLCKAEQRLLYSGGAA